MSHYRIIQLLFICGLCVLNLDLHSNLYAQGADYPRNKWELKVVQGTEIALMFCENRNLVQHYYAVQDNGPFSMFFTVSDKIGAECTDPTSYTDPLQIDVVLDEKYSKTLRLNKSGTFGKCTAVYFLDYSDWQAMCQGDYMIVYTTLQQYKAPLAGFSAATDQMNYGREIPIGR